MPKTRLQNCPLLGAPEEQPHETFAHDTQNFVFPDKATDLAELASRHTIGQQVHSSNVNHDAQTAVYY